ncbi:hypothetical protein FACS1894153_4260 [Bacteroidia bacterium]|nr:hypothetical protein FACS1894153_4260 [Bacteroidia bacterium]
MLTENLSLESSSFTLPKDIKWHFIGHLQTNKAKFISPFISLIHSVDSLKLLTELNKYAEHLDNKDYLNKQIKSEIKKIDCLLEFHISKDTTKFGLTEQKAVEILSSPDFTYLKNIRVCGVMGMATYTDNENVIRKQFTLLKTIFDNLKHSFFADNNHFSEISMGMSGDYNIAIEEGSTLIRIGSSIFS